jgi:Fe2+ or Zn2+ uptake regulation protein
MTDIHDVPCLSCQKGYNGIHTCDVPSHCPCDRADQHGEKQFLVCRNCGEAFDTITAAHEHGTADLSGCAGWCGDEGFNIVPESEAF